MVRITIELSEDYIEENSKAETFLARNEENGKNPVLGLVNMVAFGLLKSKIEEGTTEFVVSRDELDENKRKLFDNDVSTFCFLSQPKKDSKANGEE